MSAAPIDPAADLDLAFRLPENVTDENMRTLYEVIVSRMRREAQGLPMNTVQTLLIERIAYNYIVLRTKEGLAGSEGGFAHATAQKEFNTFWLSMTSEFNKQLRASDAEYRDQLLRQLGGLIEKVLDGVPDPDLKASLRQQLADNLEQIGM